MKLYRAVPIALFTEYSDNQIKFPYVEDFYAHAGYIRRGSRRADTWEANSLAEHVITDGKYFAFFPEHAIQIGNLIYPNEYLLKIIEYDFPEDIIFKLVGNGYYTANGNSIDYPETLIEYDNISGKRLWASSITKAEKLTILKASLHETFKRIQSIKEFAFYHGLSDEEIFKALSKKDFIDFITGHNLLKATLKKESRLINAPNNIINSWTITTKLHGSRLDNNQLFEINYEYLINNHLNLVLNHEAENLRNYFNNAIKNKETDEAHKLINEYHQKFHN